MKTLANTTVLSNFAAADRMDLIRQLHGRLCISNEIYEEILDGLEEGYDFYGGIDAQIHPFAEGGGLSWSLWWTKRNCACFGRCRVGSIVARLPAWPLPGTEDGPF